MVYDRMREVLALLMMVMTVTEAAEPGHSHWNTPSRDRFNFFDAELLQVLSQIRDRNVVVSPVSVKATLGMLMEGALGETADEIRSALRLPNGQYEISRYYLQSISVPNQRNDQSSGVLRVAKKIFVSDSYRINNYFRDILVRGYNSDVENVRPEVAAQTVNEWVRNKTEGHVSKLIDESGLPSVPRVIIANAVYFRGRWKKPFVEHKTSVKCFRTLWEDCMKVHMMSETGFYDYGYVPRIDAEVIILPYEGEKYSLLAVLPKSGNSIDQLTSDIVHVSLDDVASSLVRQEVYVQIPRFTAEFTSDLSPYLQKLHITKLFTSEANLSNMSEDAQAGGLFVSSMLHSAKIIVNEEGTVAAAATGAEVVPLMGVTSTSFIADHPFMFFVWDRSTGAVLFSGKVERPDGVTPEEQVLSERQAEKAHVRYAPVSYPLRENRLNWPLANQEIPAEYNRNSPQSGQRDGSRQRYSVSRDIRPYYSFNVPTASYVRFH